MSDYERLFPGKHFISTVLDALDTKTEMSGALARVYVMRSAMAGLLIGVMYLAYFSIVAAFAAAGPSLLDLGRIVGALVFGFALVFIYFSKSELLTSNMMFVAIGGYYKRITRLRSARILTLCFVGNAIGGLFLALLLKFSSITDGAVGEQMAHAVDHKLAYISGGIAGWGDLFVRAILCNFMINVAMLLVYNGIIKDDLTKCVAMVVAVFVFAFVGFEHSVANTVLLTIVGLQNGVALGPAVANIAIVLAGNFVGGGLLIGWYYAYANDDRRYLRTHPIAVEPQADVA